jgi:hypothetical protein
MKVYFGIDKEDFTIENHITSRYGFRALFFSTNIEVAELYAKFYAKKNKKSSAYIYEFNIIEPKKKIEYNYAFSYSSNFRNLIFKGFQENINSMMIKNVYDYPSSIFKQMILSDIIVIYDFSEIINFEKIKIIENIQF